ncbi:MAG: recombinase family protein [Oscillospiraceae bacterium]
MVALQSLMVALDATPLNIENSDLFLFFGIFDIQPFAPFILYLKMVALQSLMVAFNATLTQPSTTKNATLSLQNQNCINDSVKVELLLTIMSSIAQEESRSISENVRWGKRKRMADGKVTVSFAKFLGYDRGQNGEMVVNPKEAAIVRRIYSMFLQGMNSYRIATVLTEEGIPTPFGKEKWCSSSVRRILVNEKYKGDALLQKYYISDFLTKKMKKNTGELPQYYVKEDHEAIIEPEVFDYVQKIIAGSDGRRRKSSISLLSSKICCGDCGSFYGSKVWHSTDKYRKVIWQCNHKFEGKKCTTPHLTEEQIKKLFVKAVNQLIERRAEIISEYDDIINIVLSTEALEKQYTKLNFEMSQLETENEELIDLNATVALDQDEYRKKRDAIVEKYEKLKAQSEKVMQEMTDKEVRKGAIIRFWKEFEKLNFLTEFDDLLWVSLVDTLTVYSKEKILFTFRDGNTIELPLET